MPALMTVDTLSVVLAVKTHTTTLVVSMDVQACVVSSYFFIVDALITMAVALASFKGFVSYIF